MKPEKLYPDLFRVPMGLNKLKVIRDFLFNGVELLFVCGWTSFGGYMGQVRYHNAPI